MVVVSVAASLTHAVEVKVTNPTENDWAEVPVVLKWEGKVTQLGDGPLAWLARGQVNPVQRDDLDGDGTTDELVFLVPLKAGESKTVTLSRAKEPVDCESRAAAGMWLRGLVGPAWESDVVAYRFYWNDNPGLDVFGKTSPMLSLEAYASGDFNYHVETKYGLDVLKVGPALGVGGFGVWIDGRIYKPSDTLKTYFIRANGPLRSVLECQYVDWYAPPRGSEASKPEGLPRRIDATVQFSIIAGQYWGRASIELQAIDKKPLPEVVTGVVIHEDTKLIRDTETGIIGRWGRQALGDHEVPQSSDLGLGVIVDPKGATFGQGPHNNYARLTPVDGKVEYLYHASWVKEPGGATSPEEYEQKLRGVARKTRLLEVTVHP
jgi:hypothetical protein